MRTQKELREKAVGQWNLNSAYEGILPPNELARQIEISSLFPIGYITSTVMNTRTRNGKKVNTSKEYQGRWVS